MLSIKSPDFDCWRWQYWELFLRFFLSGPIRIDCTHLFVLWWKSVRKSPRYVILGGLLFWIVARPLNSREACRQKGVNSNLSSLFSPFLFVWRRKVLDGDWTVFHHGGTGQFCRECERGMLRGWDRGKTIDNVVLSSLKCINLAALRLVGRFYKLVFNVRQCFCFTWMSSRLSHRRFLSFIQSRSPLRSPREKKLRHDSLKYIAS